jgi:hypothetical protein
MKTRRGGKKLIETLIPLRIFVGLNKKRRTRRIMK